MCRPLWPKPIRCPSRMGNTEGALGVAPVIGLHRYDVRGTGAAPRTSVPVLYHERILKAVDTCLPVEKVCSIDEMACKLIGTERQVSAARELAVKVKRALREQVGECLTCSIGI